MDDLAVHPFRMLELCAGVGGLGLGVHIAVPGARTVAYLEREAFAAATLVARMESGNLAPAAVWSDLATFDARAWRGAVDCVVSGDPCQPNSNAGNRLGKDDDRFLINQVIRIVEGCRPARVFRENVNGNVAGQLEAIVGPLERMGYRVAAGIFSAASVGAPHDRERLFIMADADDAGLQGRLEAAGQGWSGPEGHAGAGGWWSAEPALDRVANGMADRVDRIRACGNGVVPLAAAYAWRALDALLADGRNTRATVLTGVAA